jgi:hypothetical protein
MFILRAPKRPSADILFPLVRKINPRRCYLSGMTEKHQLSWPPAWRRTKNFNNPKYYPFEIDHKGEDFTDNRTSNLAWVSKVYHIEKTESSWKFVLRRRKRRG